MSAAPQFPPDYRLPGQPPRRPRRRASWKKIVAWVAGVLAALVLLLVVAVAILLRSQRVHRYVLRLAQQQATAALGTNVALRNFNLRFSGISPSLDLYNVVIAGAAPYSAPPLLQADHVHVGVTVASLLHRRWYLNEVRVEHPVVRIFVDKRGVDNLPQTKGRSAEGHTSVFDLGVRHLLLDRGEAYYNDRKAILYADLHDFTFQSVFDTDKRSYSGTVSYRDGHLQMQSFNPLPHDLDAQFTASPEIFTLQRAVLRSGASQFMLTATIRDYAHPNVQAQYQARLDTGEFRRVLKNPALPAGVIHAAGEVAYVSTPNRPLIESVTVRGALNSRALRVQMPSYRGEIGDIAANYSISNGDLDVRNLRAYLLGGELTGSMTMRNLGGSPRSHLSAALHGVSLAELKSLMSSPTLRPLGVTGVMSATADATWGKTMNDLVARMDATITGRVTAPSEANAMPVDAVVHARYAAPSKQVALTNTFLRTPQTLLTLNGIASDRSALQVRLRSTNIHELATLADALRPGQPPLNLYGAASFAGTVTGSTAAPQIAGQLNATDLRVRGTAWRLLRTDIKLNPSLASLQNGELDPALRGRITFSFSTGLEHWSFTPSSPIQASLHASQLKVDDLVKAAGVQTPISGRLSANLSVRGSRLNPLGHGDADLTEAKIANEPVQSLNARFNAMGDRFHAILALRLPAGGANATLIYFPKQQAYEAELKASDIRLERLQTIKQRNMQLRGVLNLNASGQGTLSNPGLKASLQVPALEIHNQTISGLLLEAAVANHVANLDLSSNIVNTVVRGHGTVNLSGDYYANAVLDTQAIPLQPLVATFAPAQAGNVTGQTEMHATLRGPLKNRARLQAHLIVPMLAVNYKNAVQIGAATPIRADYVDGVLQLQRAILRGTGTDLQFQGVIPITSNAPSSLLVQGTIDLQLAQLLDPDISSSGQLRFNINSYGQRANPDVQGQVQIVNANFAIGTVPVGLQNGNGVLTLTKDRLDITQFQGLVGGGDVSASGGVAYRPGLQFDLTLAGHGIRVLYNNVRAGLNTNLNLAGTMQSAQLAGQVEIDQLQFTPDFDLMDFMGELGGGASTPPPTGGFSQNLQLRIGVASTSGVNLVSRTLSLQAAANLRLTGTAAQPVLLGRINLNGGDLIFRGNRYVLQGGAIDFVNPAQTQPVVNVSVNTEIRQYNIQMRFWGPADHLHTNYSSDPALPPSDIINLVAFGKTQEASAANPNPPGNLGAEQLVASQVSGQITNRIEKIAGFSQLSIDPVLGGTQGQNPGARITVQQRVTGKIFVTFSSDVTSTQSQVIKLEYQQSRRLSVSATRDQNGGFGFDARIHKTW